MKLFTNNNLVAEYASDGKFKFGTATDTYSGLADFEIHSKGALLIPSGNLGERPANAANGFIRFNTTDNQYEGYSAERNDWEELGGVRNVSRKTFINATSNDEIEFYLGSNDNSILKHVMHGSGNIGILGNVGIGFDKIQSASLTDKLRVNGNVRIDGPSTVEGKLTVNDDIELQGSVNILSLTGSSTSLNVGRNVVIGGNISVAGTSTFSNIELGSTSVNSLTIDNTFGLGMNSEIVTDSNNIKTDSSGDITINNHSFTGTTANPTTVKLSQYLPVSASNLSEDTKYYLVSKDSNTVNLYTDEAATQLITFTSTIGHTETMKIIEQPRISLDINSTDALRVPVGNNITIGQVTGTFENPIHGQKPEGVTGYTLQYR